LLSPFQTSLLFGAVASVLVLYVVAPDKRRGAWIDVALGALVGGIIGGRIAHIALQWRYFASNTHEILHSLDGTDLHGALMGAFVLAWLVARLRRVKFAHWLDVVAIALPVMALAGWFACWQSLCAYGQAIPLGASVPPFLVHDAMDAYGILDLRYATQPLGTLMSLPLIALSMLMLLAGWAHGRRFGILLLMLASMMFVLGFWRGDFMPLITLGNTTLRADQWWDALLIALGITLFLRPLRWRS
jgi:prolipoprotein diacylglyceryltransferase